jgi:hypothetical protein
MTIVLAIVVLILNWTKGTDPTSGASSSPLWLFHTRLTETMASFTSSAVAAVIIA